MATKGIDISAHQGNINLAALKDQIDFVIIRVGFGTKGTIDKQFKRNADLCRELGIPVGFYWYSYALDQNGARQEAQAMINAIAPYKDIIKYGVWFDMEDADGYKKKNGMPSNQMLQEICHEFCATTENAGYYSGIYASQAWFNNQLAGEQLNRFDKWVAQWPVSNGKQTANGVDINSRNDMSLWQFTSEGKLNGYNGKLDMNYAYKAFPNPSSTPTPAPTPAPVSRKSNEEIADEVIKGVWGNGDERKNRLTAEGYDYETIRTIVNDKLGASKSTPAPAPAPIVKGSKVKFTGTRSYSGMLLSSWVTNSIFDVIQVSGDRIVIGKGSNVTAAVNVKDCVKL